MIYCFSIPFLFCPTFSGGGHGTHPVVVGDVALAAAVVVVAVEIVVVELVKIVAVVVEEVVVVLAISVVVR